MIVCEIWVVVLIVLVLVWKLCCVVIRLISLLVMFMFECLSWLERSLLNWLLFGLFSLGVFDRLVCC